MRRLLTFFLLLLLARGDAGSFSVLPSSTAAKPAVIVLSDTFTDADLTNLTAHTMNVGPGWTAGAGSMSILSNAVTSASGGYYYSDSGKTSVTLTIDVSLAVGHAADAIVRATDANNLWLIESYNNTFTLYERNGGAFTSRASSAPTTAGSHTVRVITRANTISATFDGGSAISYESATFQNTATKHGISDGGTVTNGIDNFLVLAP